MPILPDGRIQLKNKKTGEIKVITPEEMGNFGISQQAYLKELEASKKIKEIETGVTPDTEKEAKAKSSAIGLVEDVQKLKQGTKDINLLNIIPQFIGSKLGVENDLTGFNRKRNLVSQSIANLYENGRLTDADRNFYRDEIANIKAIGPQAGKESALDELLNSALTKAGYKPDDIRGQANIQPVTKGNDILSESIMGGMKTSLERNPVTGPLKVIPQLPNVAKNAVTDVKDMGSGLLQLPQLIKSLFKGDVGIGDVGKGAVSEVGKQGARLATDPYQEFADNPVDTALFLAPLLKGAGVLSATDDVAKSASVAGKTAKAGEVASKVSTIAPTGSVVDDLLKTVGKTAKATEKSKSFLNKIGDYLTEDVMKIELEPSIWGAKREKAVKATLDKLGFKGTPDQKYAQLEPAMSQLSSQIEDILTAEAKNVSVGEVVADFEKNLKSSIRTGALDRKNVSSLAKEYIMDVYDSASGNELLSDNISTPELFKLKQLVNQDYQPVQRKIINGVVLEPKERVIAVARQTLDDVIAVKHPNVKKLTTMQSHLYDAVDSIFEARRKGNGKSLEILGTKIPLPSTAVQASEDLVGRILQNVGR